ncbi:hypothetical protein FBU59_007190 [Linderina macrospora]|uniref:Uncharacterized protein n=1 Tax=Linderina macrospora TaxID=4868 RepID=A0ACC1IXP7_9FUNG|nr:hypothetical protein FBU59_007190 [Linderina macrospora]
MQVDEEFVGGGSSLSSIATAPVLPASLQPGASLSQNSLHQAKTAAASVNAVPRNIRPRVSLPVSAPKVQQQQTGTELSVQPGVAKPRAVGAVLMAMLFSFSLFTLPSLYTSDGSLTAGGSQSAGILPAAESRLLISSGVLAKQHNESDATASSSSGGGEPPLIERVRRTISAMTQQQQPQPQPQPQVNSSNSSSSPSQKEEEEIRANKMRPMTMEESAGLHAWIKRGLATGAVAAVVL